jgi:hypothetical protein
MVFSVGVASRRRHVGGDIAKLRKTKARFASAAGFLESQLLKE